MWHKECIETAARRLPGWDFEFLEMLLISSGLSIEEKGYLRIFRRCLSASQSKLEISQDEVERKKIDIMFKAG